MFANILTCEIQQCEALGIVEHILYWTGGASTLLVATMRWFPVSLSGRGG
jgi:hypothetical protein